MYRTAAAEEDFLCLFTVDNLSWDEPVSARWSLEVVFSRMFTIQGLHVPVFVHIVDAE